MDTTPNLLLPFIMPAQAQKFVTHNSALQVLDALVMLSVASRTETAPPMAAEEGDRYIVAEDATGAWSGRTGCIAAMQSGAWSFFAPAEGWLSWCAAEKTLFCFTDGAWAVAGLGDGDLQNVPLIGINATADTTNRLSVAADASLLSHAGTSHRLVVNKQATADTASLLFQDDFSGRAEIGLTGDDHLSVKVSADGSSFVKVIDIDPATAKVRLPNNHVLESYALNLYRDGGRMAGNDAAGSSIGAFAWPAYLSLNNGAAAEAQGKFVYNNTDYGGAAGALDGAVKDLIDQIRAPDYRRYNVEFWAAVVTAGSGTTSSAVTVGAETGHSSLFTSFRVRPPALTHHAYIRALDDNVLINVIAGQTVLKDGVAHATAFAIAPADGWVSVTVRDEVDPRQSFGYQPTIFSVYAKAAGNRYLVACPALMAGITDVDDNIGVIAAYSGWSA